MLRWNETSRKYAPVQYVSIQLDTKGRLVLHAAPCWRLHSPEQMKGYRFRKRPCNVLESPGVLVILQLLLLHVLGYNDLMININDSMAFQSLINLKIEIKLSQ